MKTLLLDRTAWDLVLDTDGNIAVASDPYSIAQDICSYVRTFLGEVWYDTTKGVPYFSEVLGRPLDVNFIESLIANAAAEVPQVLTAQCTITSFEGRALSGQVQFTYQALAPGESVSTAAINSGIVTFIGDNAGIVTFLGGNGFTITINGS